MKINDIFEGWDRSEFSWHNELTSKPETYSLVNKENKVIRPGLTLAAAKALQTRPDLVKKYGILKIQKT